MWFDARAKLAEIAGQPAAIARPVSRLSQVSQAPQGQKPNFTIAKPKRTEPHPMPPARADRPDPEGLPPGDACNMDGHPRTWTGRIISLAAWRDMTDWERYGPNGRHWNGITGQWEPP